MRDSYIQIRKSIFEAKQKNQKVEINLGWFYAFYLQEFESQPSTRVYWKKDMFGVIMLDNFDNPQLDIVKPHKLSQSEFHHLFGQVMMMYSDSVLDHIDKKFNISWVEKPTGVFDNDGLEIFEKIKFVG